MLKTTSSQSMSSDSSAEAKAQLSPRSFALYKLKQQPTDESDNDSEDNNANFRLTRAETFSSYGQKPRKKSTGSDADSEPESDSAIDSSTNPRQRSSSHHRDKRILRSESSSSTAKKSPFPLRRKSVDKGVLLGSKTPSLKSGLRLDLLAKQYGEDRSLRPDVEPQEVFNIIPSHVKVSGKRAPAPSPPVVEETEEERERRNLQETIEKARKKMIRSQSKAEELDRRAKSSAAREDADRPMAYPKITGPEVSGDSIPTFKVQAPIVPSRSNSNNALNKFKGPETISKRGSAPSPTPAPAPASSSSRSASSSSSSSAKKSLPSSKSSSSIKATQPTPPSAVPYKVDVHKKSTTESAEYASQVYSFNTKKKTPDEVTETDSVPTPKRSSLLNSNRDSKVMHSKPNLTGSSNLQSSARSTGSASRGSLDQTPKRASAEQISKAVGAALKKQETQGTPTSTSSSIAAATPPNATWTRASYAKEAKVSPNASSRSNGIGAGTVAKRGSIKAESVVSSYASPYAPSPTRATVEHTPAKKGASPPQSATLQPQRQSGSRQSTGSASHASIDPTNPNSIFQADASSTVAAMNLTLSRRRPERGESMGDARSLLAAYEDPENSQGEVDLARLNLNGQVSPLPQTDFASTVNTSMQEEQKQVKSAKDFLSKSRNSGVFQKSPSGNSITAHLTVPISRTTPSTSPSTSPMSQSNVDRSSISPRGSRNSSLISTHTVTADDINPSAYNLVYRRPEEDDDFASDIDMEVAGDLDELSDGGYLSNPESGMTPARPLANAKANAKVTPASSAAKSTAAKGSAPQQRNSPAGASAAPGKRASGSGSGSSSRPPPVSQHGASHGGKEKVSSRSSGSAASAPPVLPASSLKDSNEASSAFQALLRDRFAPPKANGGPVPIVTQVRVERAVYDDTDDDSPPPLPKTPKGE